MSKRAQHGSARSRADGQDRAAWHVAEAADRLAEDDAAEARQHLRAALALLGDPEVHLGPPPGLPAVRRGSNRLPSSYATPVSFLARAAPSVLPGRDLEADAAAIRRLVEAEGSPILLDDGDAGGEAFPRRIVFNFYLDQVPAEQWGRSHV